MTFLVLCPDFFILVNHLRSIHLCRYLRRVNMSWEATRCRCAKYSKSQFTFTSLDSRYKKYSLFSSILCLVWIWCVVSIASPHHHHHDYANFSIKIRNHISAWHFAFPLQLPIETNEIWRIGKWDQSEQTMGTTEKRDSSSSCWDKQYPIHLLIR